MKKLISIFIGVFLLITTLSAAVFASETIPQETNETVEKVAPLFEVYLEDGAAILSEENTEHFKARIETIYQLYNYRITLTTKDFNYAQSYPDYQAYQETLRAQIKEEKIHNGSMLVFAPIARKDFHFMNLNYGTYSESIQDQMALFYEIEAMAKEDEETLEAMCVYLFDVALDRIERTLEEANKAPVKSVETFIGIGETIEGFDPMIDGAELFSEAEEEQLFERIETIRNQYDFDVTIMTMNEIPDSSESLRDYLDWYEGVDPERDGLVVGVNMEEWDRSFSISARNFGSEAFTEDAHALVHKEVPPLLTNGDYLEAFNLYLDYTEIFLETAKLGKPYETPIDSTTIILFVVALPLSLAFIMAWAIVKFVFVAQMKTAVMKTEAKDFMHKESLILTVQSDTFTHETETSVYDPPSDNEDGDSGDRTESDGYGGERSGSSGSF